jgi:succinylglutamic semialdehyde dehydrogenase
MHRQSVEFKGDYIKGQFVKASRTDGSWEVVSPADLEDTVIGIDFNYDHVSEAVVAARSAFHKWAHTPKEKRFEYLRRIQEVYSAHQEQLAELISRETGKPLWDSKGEARAMVGKISVTIEHSMKLVEDVRVESALPGVDGVIRYKPRGVMAVIGPFNFPGHLPNGHIIPALATGNTVVFKPSEKTAAVGQFMAELIHQAGLPEGVFNLVQGDGHTGRKLVGHEEVDGILFTGSYEVGLRIKQETINHHWKILALEMGGKNCTIVWEDADLEKAVYESIVGCFMSSGQRCSCTSKILVHKSVKDAFVENFYETAKKLKIGHWSENPFMGPLISKESVDNYLRFQEIAKREGAESLMRGKTLDVGHKGYYVTPSLNLIDKFNPDSVYQSCEIFGPNVGILEISDIDEALEVNNSSGFGLVTSIFTKDSSLYEKTVIDARVGLVNWNRTTNGASGRLPFGGMGKSGNDRPSAHFAVYYCTVPVSSLEDETPFDESKVLPGVDYQFKV